MNRVLCGEGLKIVIEDGTHIDDSLEFLASCIHQYFETELMNLFNKYRKKYNKISLEVTGFPGFEDELLIIRLSNEDIKCLDIFNKSQNFATYMLNRVKKHTGFENDLSRKWKDFLYEYLLQKGNSMEHLIEITKRETEMIVKLIEKLIELDYIVGEEIKKYAENVKKLIRNDKNTKNT